jgi:hypothetical protein
MAGSATARKLLSPRACSSLLLLAQFAAWIALARGQQDGRKPDHTRLHSVVEVFSRAWTARICRSSRVFLLKKGCL